MVEDINNNKFDEPEKMEESVENNINDTMECEDVKIKEEEEEEDEPKTVLRKRLFLHALRNRIFTYKERLKGKNGSVEGEIKPEVLEQARRTLLNGNGLSEEDEEDESNGRKGKKSTCPECNGEFINLSLHRLTHYPSQRYGCHLCPKTFSQRMYLKQHLNIHIKERKTFSCNQCPKSFKWERSLKHHMMSHRDR